jgi:Mg-chelatase subunit ChlD
MYLEQILVSQGLQVETISPSSLPLLIDGLLPYDEIILAGVAPSEIDRLRQAALAMYVRDTGGGLIFISGPQGLHRQSSGQETLETMLPVEMTSPSERQDPPIAMVLLFDRSGSMMGEKLNFAKQAALSVIENLAEHDLLGLIAFDARYAWIIPLTKLGDKAAAREKLANIGAGGGTRFYPGLEEAYFVLGSAEASIRHVVLLTDGISTDPYIFPALLAKMRAAGITVSTVAIGQGADTKLLTDIAHLGGGRYVLAQRAEEIPQIFVKETKSLQRDAAQRRDTLVKPITPARELVGIDFTHAPPLSGYLRTKAKPTAEVLLETAQRDPLLVRWQFGLGQVDVFTSDATARWAARWITEKWAGFPKLWTQLVRGAERTRRRYDLTMSGRLQKDVFSMDVEAVAPAGRFLQDLDVRALLVDGSQQTREVPLLQIGPGHYAAQTPIPLGSVMARPIAFSGAKRLEGDWIFFERAYPEELARVGPNEALLSELVRIGRGHVVTRASDLTTPEATALPRNNALATPLGFLAICVFLGDVIARRIRFREQA